MKWIIYLLVLLNVVFFTWSYRAAGPTAAPAAGLAGPTPAADLPLVEEQRRYRLEEPVPPIGPAPEPTVQSATPAAAVPAGEQRRNGAGPAAPEAVSAGEDKPPARPAPPSVAAAAPTVEPAAAGEQTARSATTPAPEATVAAESTPSQSSETAVASTAGSPPAAQAPAPPPAEAPSPPAVPRVCYTVGPLVEDRDLAPLEAWLKERKAAATSRESVAQEPRSYWVYLPPFSSVEAAREVLKKLQKDGITDFIRVMNGPMANAISLGLYSRSDSADKRMAYLHGKGYQPVVDLRYGEVRSHWLDVTVAGDKDLPAKAFAKAFPDAHLARAHCP